MKKLVLLVVAALLGSALYAQDGGGRRGNWGEYDVKKEKTYKSKVTKVGERETPRGVIKFATIELDGESYMIMLGTQEIMDKNKFTVKEGDQIEVTGILRETPMGNLINSRVITANGKKLELRDAEGKPKFRREGDDRPKE